MSSSRLHAQDTVSFDLVCCLQICSCGFGFPWCVLCSVLPGRHVLGELAWQAQASLCCPWRSLWAWPTPLTVVMLAGVGLPGRPMSVSIRHEINSLWPAVIVHKLYSSKAVSLPRARLWLTPRAMQCLSVAMEDLKFRWLVLKFQRKCSHILRTESGLRPRWWWSALGKTVNSWGGGNTVSLGGEDFKIYLLMYIFERISEKGETQVFSYVGTLPKWLPPLGLGQAKVRR